MGKLISGDILAYCEANSSPEPDYLRRLERKTYLSALNPTMMSDMLQGRLLAFISMMVKPSRILEIGSFTGYSALCLSEGLEPEGKIVAIEIDAEKESLIRSFFEKARRSTLLDLRIGDGLEIVPTLEMTFDLAFIDANKRLNEALFDKVIEKVKPGGFILIDNTLWFGKVLEEGIDKDTDLIRSFNHKITTDPRVQNLLLPFRDGLTLVRKLD